MQEVTITSAKYRVPERWAIFAILRNLNSHFNLLGALMSGYFLTVIMFHWKLEVIHKGYVDSTF